jgi:hemolysin type calcium-binding protein
MLRTTNPLRPAATAALLLALLLIPAAAHASTVTVRPDPRPGVDTDEVLYVADDEERNDVFVAYAADARSVTITDPGAVISASGPCETLDAHRAVCTKRSEASVEWLQSTRVVLGNMNDHLATTRPGPAPIGGVIADGGVGDDVLDGGAGPDMLTGGSGHDVLLGGALDDILVDGVEDADADVFDGGEGSDTVSYGGRHAPVAVRLPASAENGTTGENDELRGIENAVGSSRDDLLVGDDAANLLDGGRGDDVLQARGGDDRLEGGSGRDVLRAGNGRDALAGGSGRDSLVCGSGADLVSGPAAGEVLGRDCESLRYTLGSTREDSLLVPVNPTRSRGTVRFAMSCPTFEILDGELASCRGRLTLRETAGAHRLLGSGRIADRGRHRQFAVTLRLTAAGRRALSRRPHTIATVRISGHHVPKRAWTIRFGR